MRPGGKEGLCNVIKCSSWDICGVSGMLSGCGVGGAHREVRDALEATVEDAAGTVELTLSTLGLSIVRVTSVCKSDRSVCSATVKHLLSREQ